MQDLTKGDLIIYEDENDKMEIEAFLYDETIWLPLNRIAELFEKDKSVISRHISNIFEEKELDKNSTVANFATVQNKFHYAITNETAAEIIFHRASHKREHMGLTSWKT